MAKKKAAKTETTEERHFHLYPSQYEALRRLAFQQRTTLAEQVRRAIDAYVESQKRPKQK